MRDLTARLEAHTGEYDSRHDEQIARAIGWEQDDAGEWHQIGNFFGDGLRRTAYAVDLPPFTRSLDAALTLVPEGCGISLVRFTGQERSSVMVGGSIGYAATPALALCVAALRARAAQEGRGDAS